MHSAGNQREVEACVSRKSLELPLNKSKVEIKGLNGVLS